MAKQRNRKLKKNIHMGFKYRFHRYVTFTRLNLHWNSEGIKNTEILEASAVRQKVFDGNSVRRIERFIPMLT